LSTYFSPPWPKPEGYHASADFEHTVDVFQPVTRSRIPATSAHASHSPLADQTTENALLRGHAAPGRTPPVPDRRPRPSQDALVKAAFEQHQADGLAALIAIEPCTARTMSASATAPAIREDPGERATLPRGAVGRIGDRPRSHHPDVLPPPQDSVGVVPRAHLSVKRLQALAPPVAVATGFWISRHLLGLSRAGHDNVLQITWAMMGALVIINLVIAWTEHAAVVTPRQQRQLDQLRVTVNVPVYNEDPAALRLMVASLFGQSRLPNRIQIVDDGSACDYTAVIAEFEAIAAYYPTVDASWKRTGNGGKRHAQLVTFSNDQAADIFVTLDSDTVLDEAAIEEGLKPFADPRVASVAGVLLTLNATRNIFTRLTDTWLTTFQSNTRSAWSRLGCVLINSGGLSFYRARIVRNGIPAYTSEMFAGREVRFSDDSMLTLFALLEGRTVQQPTAFAFTVMPDNINHHVRQQLRWMRGNVIRSFWWFRYLPLCGLAFWEAILAWAMFTVMTALLADLFIVGPVLGHPVPVPYLPLFLAITYVSGARSLAVRRSDMSRGAQLAAYTLMPVISLWTTVVLRALRLYSTATVLRTGWGTRAQVENRLVSKEDVTT
jgi:hyaluronan synthase